MDCFPLFPLWLAGLLAYAHLAEYAVHRWAMHRPFFGRNSSAYRDHHVEHHGKSRNDINIDASPLVVTFLASPFFAGCYWLGWPWAFAVLLFCAVYADLWTRLHFAIHSKPFLSWDCPLLCPWIVHHHIHHANPGRNFGTLFPWTDYLFGTKA